MSKYIGHYVLKIITLIIKTKGLIIKTTIILFIIFMLSSCSTQKYKDKNENYYNDLFCDKVNGKREVRHYYGKNAYILVDCETRNYVYEGGKDKRSSLDSVQQAVFASILTNKKPAIVIFDTNNKIGKYEHRIKSVADKLKIKFILER